MNDTLDRQPTAAHTLEEKFSEAGKLRRSTGASPSMALHVLWDFPGGIGDVAKVGELDQYGIRPGAINPNLFQDQVYKRLVRQPRSRCSPARSVCATGLSGSTKVWRPPMRRSTHGLPADPLQAFRASGYIARVERERGNKNKGAGSSYAKKWPLLIGASVYAVDEIGAGT